MLDRVVARPRLRERVPLEFATEPLGYGDEPCFGFDAPVDNSQTIRTCSGDWTSGMHVGNSRPADQFSDWATAESIPTSFIEFSVGSNLDRTDPSVAVSNPASGVWVVMDHPAAIPRSTR